MILDYLIEHRFVCVRPIKERNGKKHKQSKAKEEGNEINCNKLKWFNIIVCNKSTTDLCFCPTLLQATVLTGLNWNLNQPTKNKHTDRQTEGKIANATSKFFTSYSNFSNKIQTHTHQYKALSWERENILPKSTSINQSLHWVQVCWWPINQKKQQPRESKRHWAAICIEFCVYFRFCFVCVCTYYFKCIVVSWDGAFFIISLNWMQARVEEAWREVCLPIA